MRAADDDQPPISVRVLASAPVACATGVSVPSMPQALLPDVALDLDLPEGAAGLVAQPSNSGTCSESCAWFLVSSCTWCGMTCQS